MTDELFQQSEAALAELGLSPQQRDQAFRIARFVWEEIDAYATAAVGSVPSEDRTKLLRGAVMSLSVIVEQIAADVPGVSHAT